MPPISCSECLKLHEKSPVCHFEEKDCWAYSEPLKQPLTQDCADLRRDSGE